MKRQTERPLLNIDERVTVVHFNVGCGYMAYLETPEGEERPRLRGVLLTKSR